MIAVTTETLQVSGIRCERCVHRLAAALSGHEGLEAANANLMGQVTLSWDEETNEPRRAAGSHGPGRFSRPGRSAGAE